jgi:hypothetical protein
MIDEIHQERDMEPDPMFRIKCLQKQLQWMEGQRYDLETTISSLRAILRLIIDRIEVDNDDMMQSLIAQANRMLKL